MAKKQQGNPMKNALAAAAASSTPEPVEEAETKQAPANTTASTSPSSPKKRRGRPVGSGSKAPKGETKLIGGHFDPAVARQFKMLAAEQGRTIQDMLGEGLNDLFVKYKKKPIA
jgi:hypothetical protein